MLPKRFFVKIEFQLHAVTCPGVWLCTHGYLEVTIKTLGYFFRTGAMEPRFPLLCHDKFTMDGYFKSVGSISDLERVLAAEQVEVTLWQNGRRMAYFLGKLADVMHSDMPKLTCEHNINVTCPGVWLCTHGYLEVTIKTLGYFFRTGAMEPRFPLLCHDKFTMDGYFKSVGSISDLERVLAAEQVEVTLWQNGRRMAYFLGKLADVMHSDMPKLTCEHNINVQILMKPTPAFPGIIAPKVELSARVGVKDRLATSHHETKKKGSSATGLHEIEFEATHVPNRHSQQQLQSSQEPSCFSYLEERRRQRAVCHAKTSCGSGFSTASCAQPCGNASKLFDIDSVACKSDGERRLSIDSSNYSNSSLNLSQITRMSSPCQHNHYACSTSSITAPDEHQRQCYICQTYRKVFS